MTDYIAYFLNSPASVFGLDTLEITHSNFTKPYYLVRNAEQGLTARLETGALVSFDFYPMRLRTAGASDDLDYSLRVDLGDLGEVIPKELDEISDGGGFGEKPVVRYRLYRSDDLLVPMLGPVRLEIGSFNFNREGSTFEASAPSLNINRTGELYRVERFPMLRGFL